jgi:hypothetical protein
VNVATVFPLLNAVVPPTATFAASLRVNVTEDGVTA